MRQGDQGLEKALIGQGPALYGGVELVMGLPQPREAAQARVLLQNDIFLEFQNELQN